MLKKKQKCRIRKVHAMAKGIRRVLLVVNIVVLFVQIGFLSSDVILGKLLSSLFYSEVLLRTLVSAIKTSL